MAPYCSEMMMKSNLNDSLFQGWRSLYHIKSDRMIDVKVVHNLKRGPLYIDLECNVYPHNEFYHWKSTE